MQKRKQYSTKKRVKKIKPVLTFTDVYKFPLELQYSTKVMTPDFEMAFDFIPSFIKDIDSVQISKDDKLKIVRLVNGSDETSEFLHTYRHENGTIYMDDLALIWIRGWGHLTGGGGLRLPETTAVRLQNELADFIISKLEQATKHLS